MPEKILFQSKSFPEFRFLSNFHVQGFEYRDYYFSSSEHAYQAEKVEWGGKMFDRIRQAPTCKEARALGQRVVLGPDWEQRKLQVMYDVCLQKFTQNDDMKQTLLATEDLELVEFAPWGDRFWGVDKDLVGENNLGKILMRIRVELK